MIKNNTPYLGKIKLKFEKYPEYTGGSFLNKVHLNLGFTKLVSRIYPIRTKSDGFKVDPYKVELINKFTGGKIGEHKFGDEWGEDNSLPNSFLSQSGVYIGDIRDGWWYYTNNLVVCDDYPHGVAEMWTEDGITSYYGYSHRGGSKFEIGDRLFDEKYEPKEDDYEEWEWSGWLMKYEESLSKAKNSDDDWWYEDLKTDGVSGFIPFAMRGSKVIENLEEAKQAAINMSKYLS